MPQLQIASNNINNFSFSVKVDIYNKRIIFDASATTYFGSGISLVQGIAFSVVDQQGVVLLTNTFPTTQIPTPASSQVYTLDVSNIGLPFLLQSFTIIGSIKDQNGTVYSTIPVVKTVCQPTDLTDSGYVPGIFQLTPDCVDNSLTVKELTLLVYNNEKPVSVSKTGVLYYPTGTISSLPFMGTPFTNNVVYTGQYRITCTTVATYDMGDGVYVLVSYVTDCPFDVTCANRISDLMCCLVGIQQTAKKECNNALGKHAQQQMYEILPSLIIGLGKEINGQDASTEADFIRKTLNCDCGNKSIRQNELTPINPSVYNIVISGIGGTTVPSTTTVGSTKTFNIQSNIYQVTKGNTGDLAYTIVLDTSVANTVKYVLTFNYDTMAGYILNAIAANPTLLQQLQNLANILGIDLTGLNGSCVIDLTKSDYFLTQVVTNTGWTLKNIVINGVTYSSPAYLVNNTVSINTFLNSLSLGTFLYGFSGPSLLATIQSLQNPNVLATMSFQSTSPTTGVVTTAFTRVNKTLVQVLQAIINYICGMTALQVALGNSLGLCSFDYSGNLITTNYNPSTKQGDFNAAVSASICGLASRMANLTGVTCAKLQAIFQDNPAVVFGAGARLYGTDGNSCISFTDKQIANLIIAAVGKYSDVKTAWCAIDCTVPGTCPDVSANNVSVVSGNIGVYGLTWTQSPVASQTVTVSYRVHGTTNWNVATNNLVILPNGNVSSNPPYLITGLTPGQSYDVWIRNNCGGTGFISVVTTPTGTVYSGSFLLDNVIYNICGESPVTLYSNAPFATGVIMYTDIGLTTPRTGFTFIAPTAGGEIFHINTVTGLVGATTGSSCTSGTAGSYLLGNNSGTICATSPTTLYTNGAFVIGGTLYTDSGLTNHVSGFSFVVNLANNHIYNLNSSTGAIISDTFLTCSNAHGVINVGACLGSPSITNVLFNGVALVLGSGSFPVTSGSIAPVTCTNPGINGTLQVTVTNVTGSESVSAQDSNGAIPCVNAPGSTTVTFLNFTIDSRGFEVAINCTPC